jgi:dihydropyrimidine dehydrogenase (NAD+) subunit PreA
VGALARDPEITVPISGIGGISTWRDAAEFIAIGATSVQVCTAVMQRGYRIVEDMIEGLNDFLDERGMKSVMELHRKAVPSFVEWGELDLVYQVKARIDAQKCIGCDLCYVACMDGAHQCIHRPWEKPAAGHLAPGHALSAAGHAKDKAFRVPWVDETECVGCNLCALVCPVEGCITMTHVNPEEPGESWNERVAAGRGVVPGGLHS